MQSNRTSILGATIACVIVALVFSVAVIGCGESPRLEPNLSRSKRIKPVTVDDQGSKDPGKWDGFATISGTITYNGDSPAATSVKIDKDGAICGVGGTSRQYVKINPQNNGIQNVIVYLDTKIPSSKKHDIAKNRKADFVLDQKGCVFIPHVMAVQTDQPFTVKNSDPVNHNAKIGPLGESVGPGKQKDFVIKRQSREPIQVACAFHGWMKAWILPRSDGYFAITDENGHFEIPNLPTGGKLKIRVWHESAKGGKPGSIKVGVPAPLASSGTGFTVTLTKDQHLKDLVIEMPTSAF